MEEALPTPKLLLDSVPHVPRAQVVITNKIGEGAFGEVSRAEVFPYGTVAIKWLKVGRGGEGKGVGACTSTLQLGCM